MKNGFWINRLICSVAFACLFPGFGSFAQAEILDYFANQSALPIPIYSNGFDLNADGIVDIVFESYSTSTLGAFPGNNTNSGTYYFLSGTNGAQVLAAGDSLQILSAGELIGDSVDWSTNILELAFQPGFPSSNNPPWLGPLGDAQQGFIGLRLQTADGPHYGWSAVRLPGARQSNPLVTDWAFEAAPNQPLRAGDKPVYFTASFHGANEVPPNQSPFAGVGNFTLDPDTNGNYSLSYSMTLPSNFRPHSIQIFEAANPMAKASRRIASLSLSSVPFGIFPGLPLPDPLPGLPPGGIIVSPNPGGIFPGIIVTSLPPFVIIPGPGLIVSNISLPLPPPRSAKPQPVNPLANRGKVIADPFPNQSLYHGQISLTDDQVSDLVAGQLYVNFTSAMYQSGELRGELLPTAPIRFTTTLSGTNGVFRTSSPHHGEVLLDLGANWMNLYVALDSFAPVTIDVYGPTMLNSARPSLIYSYTPPWGYSIPSSAGTNFWPVGFPGQILYQQGFFESEPPFGSVSLPELTDAEVYELMHGKFYINITTGSFQQSEISGWLVSPDQ